MKSIKTIFILIIVTTIAVAKNPVSVSIEHPIYKYLDRLETLGIIDNIRDGVKPFDRGQISKMLLEISGKRDLLTKIDRDKLNNFLADFRYELDVLQKYPNQDEDKNWYTPFSSFSKIETEFYRFFKNNQPEEENHTLLWEDSTNSFYLDFIQDFTYDSRNDDLSRSANTQSYYFRGNIGENFGYALRISLIAIRGDEGYRENDPILKGSWFNVIGNTIYFDRSGGELAYHTPFVDLRFAHQPITWGVGESGNLILSDNVEQFPYLSISKSWSWGTFTFLHGKLLAEPNDEVIDDQKIFPDKWIASHRLEFSPFAMMSIGLTEMLIYGNRTVDWAYLVPFNLYRSTQHTLHDRDNELIAIDFETKIINNVKVYGAVLLDEFKKSKLFTNWYGNKHGFQIGTHVVDPFGLNNLSLRFEYVAVMPWVYTHKYNINRYINNMRPLGYWAGPNSEVLYAHLSKDFHHRLTAGVKFSRLKHGDNYPDENIGGNILVGHNTLMPNQTTARETRKFLEGILTTEEVLEFYSQYEIFNDMFLNFRIASINAKLDQQKQNLTEIHFGFKLDY